MYIRISSTSAYSASSPSEPRTQPKKVEVTSSIPLRDIAEEDQHGMAPLLTSW